MVNSAGVNVPCLALRPVTTSRSMTFSSSRTLPGQEYSHSRRIVSGASPLTGVPLLRVNAWKKCSMSSGMSSRRSRSAGTVRWMTLSR